MSCPAETVDRVDNFLGDLSAWDTAKETNGAGVTEPVKESSDLRLEQDDANQDGDLDPGHAAPSKTAAAISRACRLAWTAWTRNQVAPSMSAATLAPTVPLSRSAGS